MKRIASVLFIAILLTLLLQPVVPVQAGPDAATVSGRLTRGSQPMVGKTVTLTFSDHSTYTSAPSAADGSYSITISPAPSMGATPSTLVPQTVGGYRVLPLRYSDAEILTTGMDFNYAGAYQLNGSIYYSGTSTPMVGVTVSLIAPPGYDTPDPVVTNAEGKFTVFGLEPVTYNVNPGPLTDHFFSPAFWIVDFSSGSQERNFIASKPGRLVVFVLSAATKDGLPGFTMQVSAPGFAPVSHVSEAGKSWLLENLLENLTYTAAVTAIPDPKFELLTGSLVIPNVKKSPLSYAYLVAVAKPYITGTVKLGTKVKSGITVCAQNLSGEMIACSATDNSGKFYLDANSSGFADGKYLLTPYPVGSSSNSIYTFNPIPVTIAGASVKGINISLTNLKVPIQGWVRTTSGVADLGSSGVPLAGVTFTVQRCSEVPPYACPTYPATAVSDASGFYRLVLPAVDEAEYLYIITAKKAGFLLWSEEDDYPYWELDGLYANDFDPGDMQKNPNWLAYKTYTVSGKVINKANGAGIAGIRVTADTIYKSEVYTREAETKADGSYSIAAVPDLGETKVQLLPSTYHNSGMNPASYGPYAPISANLTGINFTTVKKLYTLSGKVLKAGSTTPVGGVKVTVSSPDGGYIPIPEYTGLTGAYKFSNLPEGYTYHLTFERTGYVIADKEYAALSGSKNSTSYAALAKRTVNVMADGMTSDSATLKYRQTPGGTWKSLPITAAGVNLELYQAFSYEVTLTSSKYRFSPPSMILPPEASTPGKLFSAVEMVSVTGSAKVKNAAGTDVAVSNVTIIPSISYRPASAKTSTSGAYSLQVDRNQTFDLQAVHAYFSFPPLSGLSSANPLTGQNFGAGAWVTVTGRVQYANGVGVEGAKVYTCTSEGWAKTLTNPQGYFRLKVPAAAGRNLFSFTTCAQKAGLSFTPSMRPVSPTYGKDNKKFIVVP